ncbi:MAG: DMT family transporter [Actinobacteria bacterium]|nr:DMT family transporter [Actinomycetota bacterium]
MRKNSNLLGVVLIIGSSIGFGLSPTFANFAYDNGASVVGTLLARFCVATLLMLIVRKVSSQETKWPKPKLFLQIFLLGAFGYFIATLLYFTALKNIDSGLAIIIVSCGPVIVVLLSWWLLGTKPSRIIVVCLASTTIGVIIAAGQVGSGDAISVVLVLIVAVEYSFYIVFSSQILPKIDLLTGVTIVMFGAATSFIIYYFLAPSSVEMSFPNNINGWISVVLLATVATVIPTATLYAGMKLIGTGKTAVLQTFEPVSSIVAGVVFLGEPLTMPRVIGAIFVIGAVGSLAASESRNETAIPH